MMVWEAGGSLWNSTTKKFSGVIDSNENINTTKYYLELLELGNKWKRFRDVQVLQI